MQSPSPENSNPTVVSNTPTSSTPDKQATDVDINQPLKQRTQTTTVAMESDRTSPPTPQSEIDALAKKKADNRSRFWKYATFAIAVAAVYLIWEENYKYRFIAKRWGEVVEGKVYRSGKISRWKIEDSLVSHNIHTVIDLCAETYLDPEQIQEEAVCAKHNIRHLRIPLGGNGVGAWEYYSTAVSVVDECERAGNPILVHCSAGSQRTGGVVALYRMLVQNRPAEEAYKELEAYDWRLYKGRELIDFLNENVEDIAKRLVELGTIPEVPSPLPQLTPPT